MTRPHRPCLDCGRPTTDARCPDCRRRASRARDAQPHRATRWDAAHRARRRAWVPVVATGTVPCARCGVLIRPGEPFDLDHLAEGLSLPSHALCNRAAGGASKRVFSARSHRWHPFPAAGTVPTPPEARP